MDDAEQLADQVADAITALTGHVWDRASRRRLTAALDDPQLRGMATRWLRGDRPDDPTDIDWARWQLSRVLSGRQDEPSGIVGVLHRRRWRRPH